MDLPDENTPAPLGGRPTSLPYATPERRTALDALAVTSVVCALLPPLALAGVLLADGSARGIRDVRQFMALIWFVCPIAAVLFGMAARSRIKEPDLSANRSLASAGAITGGVCLLLLLSSLLMIPSTGLASERANRVKCASNLKQVGMAIFQYANDHGGVYPQRLDQLITHCDLNTECFVCPSSTAEKAYGLTTQEALSNFINKPNSHCSYVYVGASQSLTAAADTIIAYEHFLNHEKEGMNVLYNDGHVEWLNAKEAEHVLRELQAGRNPPRR